MGEIKSTLDLVMARTRHLTMTDEEKQNHRTEKIQQHLQGLIQKFQDHGINLTQLQDALAVHKKDGDSDVDGLLAKAVLQRMELTADNSLLLTLLEDVCRLDTAGLQKILEAFQTSAEELKKNREKQLLSYFSEAHHVSGSAVMPNLAKDEAWQEGYRRLVEAYESRLADEGNRLI